MTDYRKLEELSWQELQQAVEKVIAADGPNTDDLSMEDFFAVWMQFDTERMLCVDVVESRESRL
jgi:hypothetical protein